MEQRSQRVAVYVDGLNLHNGLLESRLPRWLDPVALGREVLQSGQKLAGVRYFTSLLIGNKRERHKQDLYLQVLEAQGAEIVLGRFYVHQVRCPQCGGARMEAEEKQTDVNMAVRLLADAHRDLYDRAVLVSADSDLLPPVLEVPRLFPSKTVVVGFPPGRISNELRQKAPNFRLSAAHVRRSLAPSPVVTSAGRTIVAPRGWLPRR